MNLFIKQIVLKKIKQLSPRELLYYANEYGFELSPNEADEIVYFLQTESIDPFTIEGQKHLLENLSIITNQNTAQKAYQLFRQLIANYGLEHYFE